MEMNLLEKLAMNNPLRTAFQRWYEVPLLKNLGGSLIGKNVLEIGCGRGEGTKLIIEKLGAAKVTAIDLDKKMVELATRRLSKCYSSDRLQVMAGDITKLHFSDASFDGIVDFAAIHHVEDWQATLNELARVLKPGGMFLFQEVTARFIHRYPYSVIFKHPMENRFSGLEFVEQVERAGILVGDNWVEKAKGDFVYGVGRKLGT